MPLPPLRSLMDDFVAIRRIVRATHLALNEGLRHREQAPEKDIREAMGEALHYLNQVREGFTLSVRTADVSDRDEIRYLLRRTLLDWDVLEAWGLQLAVDNTIYQVGAQLLYFAMSAIALGFLPRFPQDEVTFPLPPSTYRDISVPRTPGEMMTRLEELEQVIWKAGVQPLAALDVEALRRTYGFFESSTWLIEQEWRRFHPLQP